jgi:hypothetical protein
MFQDGFPATYQRDGGHYGFPQFSKRIILKEVAQGGVVRQKSTDVLEEHIGSILRLED